MATKYAIRKPTRSVHFNARLPREVSDWVREYAQEHGLSASSAAAQLLDEARRMDRFPGIDFRWTSLGRRPFVTGTGLLVWELHHVWLDHKKDGRRVLKNYPHLGESQIRAAVAYAQAFPQEEPKNFWGVRPKGIPVVRV